MNDNQEKYPDLNQAIKRACQISKQSQRHVYVIESRGDFYVENGLQAMIRSWESIKAEYYQGRIA